MRHPADEFPFIVQRLLNAPLAIHPPKMEMIVAALAERLGVSQLTTLDGRVLAFEDDEDEPLDPSSAAPQRPKGFDLVGGVAVIYVQGTLVQKLSSLRPYSGMTGYNGIRANLIAALDDPAVKAIVLDVDSPGGECDGCFDLCDFIFGQRKAKPIWAICTSRAYSAGYALASSASKVIVPSTGGTGSVGIICAHTDFSGGLANAGIAITLITYGDRKADFSETAPLSKQALMRAQADVDAMGGMFDDLVARNRDMATAKVKSYQAGTFMGANGVSAGFADAVMPPDRAFRALASSLPPQRGRPMIVAGRSRR